MCELLSPAGNFTKMKSAILYGADAVYLSGRRFGMRAAADNFTIEELAQAVDYAHARGIKVYLTLNISPRTDEYAELEEYLRELEGIPVDALIVADLGVIELCRRILPSAELHVSTQAGAVSANTCEAYLRMGCRRVVLARELTMDEMRTIRKNTSREVSLEAFIHGSMCVSFSGRCLLSNYLTGRDANRGMCAQPCRWEYTSYEIEEVKRPDMRFPVEQTERGTFIMSSKDMCMIEHIPELMESGIDSFKIEGRMKSEYYAAVTTNAYRMAIDAYAADPSGYRYDPRWLEELESVSHREYCTGYYFDSPHENAQLVTQPGYIREKAYIARAASYDETTGRATFIQRNKLSVGDTLELITPGQVGRSFVCAGLRDADGNEIEAAPHPLMEFSIDVPFEVKEGDIIRAV